MKCLECESEDDIHRHHVVPKSKGGTKTVPLCRECHSKVHGIKMGGSELTRAALLHKKRIGEVYCGVPLGYRAEGGHLVEVDEEQRIITEVRDMRQRGMSLRAIANDLNGRGIVGKRGGRFGAQTIKLICDNALHSDIRGTGVPNKKANHPGENSIARQ